MRAWVVVAGLAAVELASTTAEAEPSARERFAEMLRERFAAAEVVEYVEVRPDLLLQSAIYRETGEAARSKAYAFWRARSRRGETIGWAHLGRERSQHGTFLFAVFFDATPRVTAVEVVEYRENEGSEIRGRPFLRQFVGATLDDRPAIGRDVDAVTGATISSSALTRGVRRSLLLLATLVPR